MATDRDFDAVIAGSFEPYAATPALPKDRAFRGIRVAAPARVRPGPDPHEPTSPAFARIMLCGAYHLDSDYLGLQEAFLERVLVIAVDAATHKAFVGRIITEETGIPRDEIAMASPPSEGTSSVMEFFNVNLAVTLPLPGSPADYFAYAAIGEYVSNVVRIEVRA